MSSLFHQAAVLNNQGINAFNNGDHASGIQYLAMSIKFMKAALSRAQHQQQQQQGHCTTNNAPFSAIANTTTTQAQDPLTAAAVSANIEISTIRIKQRRTSSSCCRRSPQSAGDNDTTTTIVFDKFLRIGTTATLSSSSASASSSSFFMNNKEDKDQNESFMLTETEMNIYTSIVVFNLALGYHLLFESGRGGRIGSSSSHSHSAAREEACMIKAEKLYEMVLRLVLNEDDDNVSSSTTTPLVDMDVDEDENMQNQQRTTRTALLLMIKLGCMNNLLQIRFARGKYECNCNDNDYYFLFRRNLNTIFEQIQQISSLSSSSSSKRRRGIATTTTGTRRGLLLLRLDADDDDVDTAQQEPLQQFLNGLLLNILLFKAPTTAAAA